MSIANELSSDIAAAVLARKNDEASVDSSELKDVVMQVHSTLRHLTTEARKRNRRSQSSAESLTAKSAASNP
jgi:predicted transcriptional regulator